MSQLSYYNFLFVLLFRHKISVIIVLEVGAKVGLNDALREGNLINVINADALGGPVFVC